MYKKLQTNFTGPHFSVRVLHVGPQHLVRKKPAFYPRQRSASPRMTSYWNHHFTQ